MFCGSFICFAAASDAATTHATKKLYEKIISIKNYEKILTTRL
jgi:hypothetical protein